MQFLIQRGRIESFALSFVACIALLAGTCGVAVADGEASLSGDGTTLTFTGDGIDASTLTVKYESFAWVLEEATVNLDAGTGCSQVNSKKVNCASISVVEAVFEMGGGQDTLTMGSGSNIPAHVNSTINDVEVATAGDGPVNVTTSETASAVMGGPNYDTITFYGDPGSIDGGAKDDQITVINDLPASEWEDPFTFEIDPHFVGGNLTGGDGNDLVDASQSGRNVRYSASEGDDVFLGGSGNDEIVFGIDLDFVFGNGGDDRFYTYGSTTADESEAWGGHGNDFFTDMDPSHADSTHFEGGPGIDTTTWVQSDSEDPGVRVSLDAAVDDGIIQFGGGTENDHMHPSVENVGGYFQLQAGSQMSGDDEIYGSERPNRIHTSNGNDVVESYGGNDNIIGYSGNDTIDAGTGNDVISLGSGDDTVDGGTGTDRVSYAVPSAVTVDLSETGVQDTGGGGEDSLVGIENLWGSSYADTLSGNSGPNAIDGRSGNDTINAVDGGIDTITCGLGTDTVNVDEDDVITDPGSCETVNVE